MTLESDLYTLLSPLVNGRMYPDTTPNNPTYPCITYQQVGGDAYWYVSNELPNHKSARVQINVHSQTRAEANMIARQIEETLCLSDMIARPYGAFTATNADALELYGTRQDFGFWYAD